MTFRPQIGYLPGATVFKALTFEPGLQLIQSLTRLGETSLPDLERLRDHQDFDQAYESLVAAGLVNDRAAPGDLNSLQCELTDQMRVWLKATLKVLDRWVRLTTAGTTDIKSPRGKLLTADLATAWSSGAMFHLIGGQITATELASRVGQPLGNVKPLLDRLSDTQLLRQTPSHTRRAEDDLYVLEAEARFGISPIAAMTLLEIVANPVVARQISADHVRVVSQLCAMGLTAADFGRQRAAIFGNYALLCELPGEGESETHRVGQMIHFDNSEVLSISPFTPELPCNGGTYGTITDCLCLMAFGDWKRMKPIGPDMHGGNSIARALLTSLRIDVDPAA